MKFVSSREIRVNPIRGTGRVLDLVLVSELTVAHDDRHPADWRQVGEYRRNAKRAERKAPEIKFDGRNRYNRSK